MLVPGHSPYAVVAPGVGAGITQLASSAAADPAAAMAAQYGLAPAPNMPTGTMLTSPAAVAPTAWVAEPSTAGIHATEPSFLDAVADVLDPAGSVAGMAATAASAGPASGAPAASAADAAAGADEVSAEPSAAVASWQAAAAAATLPAARASGTAAAAPAPAPQAVAATYAANAAEGLGKAASAARRKGSELWAGIKDPRGVHVSQVPSRYNPKPAAGNRDCGPASVVMALRLLGRSIPGIGVGAAPQRYIDRVRQLAGNVTSTASTTNHELELGLQRAGAKVREIFDLASVKQAIASGKPVILNGNPRNPGAYGPRFAEGQMHPCDGSHWMLVSGFDEASGKFIVNDPLSKVGPVKVSPEELEAYRAGSLGIEVS